LLVAGCSQDQAKVSASATPTSAVAPGAKTHHIKHSQGECTFDFDAPEEMKESKKDGVSFTLESASFDFIGFEGSTLHLKPEHGLDASHGQYRDVYRGTENGVQVAILAPIDEKKNYGNRTVSGMGGEPYRNDRSLGCTFLCEGVRAREGDVVKMCKSVRITVKPATKK
jgi:hypothetical protein